MSVDDAIQQLRDAYLAWTSHTFSLTFEDEAAERARREHRVWVAVRELLEVTA